jgi:hypothetical protein
MLALPPPRFTPCERCGASLAREQVGEHVCDGLRRLEYELFQLRDGIERLDADFASWLETPHGRFESFYASYRRLTDR